MVIEREPDRSKGYYGGGVTAPVFKKIADWVYSRTPRQLPELPKLVNINKTFSTPEFKVDYENPKIPNVIGKSGVSVIPALENLGLDVRYSGIGKVVNQSIPAGTAVRRGETIYLVLEG